MHLREGTECQDALGWKRLPGRLLLAVAADGAGSSSQGGQGAREAVTATLDRLERELPLDPGRWKELLKRAATEARDHVLRFAGSSGMHARELASTLLAVIVSERDLAALQVGDGTVAVRTDGGAIASVSGPPEREHLNETAFLTDAGAVERASILRETLPLRGVALMTDGLQTIATDLVTGQPHGPFFDPLFQTVDLLPEQQSQSRIESFLGSNRVTERIDDDISLLIASISAEDRTGQGN
ncbi:MAG TPA: PP2C family serine/threonine-protein phosphatase [Chthonomonadales bacterium]|nr:PP2C family serine/threonine-protein phosphatase [Chthonomonadales bacterium]